MLAGPTYHNTDENRRRENHGENGEMSAANQQAMRVSSFSIQRSSRYITQG